jgi:hypothetical protein
MPENKHSVNYLALGKEPDLGSFCTTPTRMKKNSKVKTPRERRSPRRASDDRPHEVWPSSSMVAMLGTGGSDGDSSRMRRDLQGSEVCTTVWVSFVYQFLQSNGLDVVLRRRAPPILCLCMWLLVEPILVFSSLITIYDICIYATFYNDLCFAR